MNVCHSCGRAFEDYRALAVHISNEKRGHRKGKKWAANFLLKNVVLKEAKPERIALTEEQKESKKSTVREVSGEMKSVTATCPKCRRSHMASVEVEYTESPFAWRIQNKIAVMCQLCLPKS